VVVVTADAAFLGTGWAFPPRFDPASGRAVMVSLADDVAESLRILMATTPGERVMQPTYGCGLKRLVFAHMDQSTLTEIRDAIEQAVLFHEVRITLDEVVLDTEHLHEGRLHISLHYTVRQTNTRHNVVFPFYHLQGTGLAAPG
jgi:phage baseplate assembly protein W